jgi:DNA-binding MarR family transcriptional regulator/N-acetylglutamate synthase-like GNAT family acetyltransferase
MPPPARTQVDAVRAFNRFYTRRIGLLREGLLDTPYSLTQARVIYELAQHPGVSSTALGEALGLDAGYLSRLIARFERAGLVARRQAAGDARVRELALTAKGRRTFQRLDSRSAAEVEAQLAGLSDDARAGLVGAMQTIRAALDAASLRDRVRLRAAVPGDMGWVIGRHGALYATEYGWDGSFEALVARIVARFVERFDPSCEGCWIAEVGGARVGSVFLVRKSARVGQLRLLLVDPAARGAGVGSRLVRTCVDFARQAGYRRVVLWTNDILHAARHIYEREGFQLIDQKPHRNFGRDLVGQTWALELTTPAPTRPATRRTGPRRGPGAG